jgi:hypothetical protein
VSVGVNSMPENESRDCDRVFGTRINFLEEQVKELKTELKRFNDRENNSNSRIETRLALAERDIKWWGILAGLFGGFGFELVTKFFR